MVLSGFPHHSGPLTTFVDPLLQNFNVYDGHLSIQSLSRAQEHGFHSRTLQQSDLVLTIQREEACQEEDSKNQTPVSQSSVSSQKCPSGKKNTWNIFGKLHQNLNLTCCHFRQQQEVFLGAVLVLELESIVYCQLQYIQPPKSP